MQDANRGFLHNVWRAAQQKGDELDADFVKVSMLGQTIVIAVSPEAVNCIVKRQKWVPKNAPSYNIFRWLVRACGSPGQSACLARHVVYRLHQTVIVRTIATMSQQVDGLQVIASNDWCTELVDDSIASLTTDLAAWSMRVACASSCAEGFTAMHPQASMLFGFCCCCCCCSTVLFESNATAPSAHNATSARQAVRCMSRHGSDDG